MHTPAISIVLPVHNGMPYLPETVDSILAQTFRDYELLLIDDGSTDDTPNYIRAIDDRRVSYHRLNKTGFVEAMNYGLKAARASLVARIDGDDIALPERLEKQYMYLTTHPRCVLVGCDFYDIDASSRIVGRNDFRYTSNSAIRWLFLFTNPMLHPGVMYAREEVLSLGGYRKAYESTEDYDLWTRLSNVGEIANVPDVLMKKRWHAKSMSVERREIQARHGWTLARSYAQAAFPQVDVDSVVALNRLMGGKPDVTFPVRRLISAFEQLAMIATTKEDSTDGEMTAVVRQIREYLAWRCQAFARSNLRWPRRAFSYMRAGSLLDPSNRSMRGLLLRKMTRLLNG